MSISGLTNRIVPAAGRNEAPGRTRRGLSPILLRGLFLGLFLMFAGLAACQDEKLVEIDAPAMGRGVFPTLDPQHRHARALLENAMRYLSPKSGIKDPSSGYPVEGWNDQPERDLELRSFTQLTAIGGWVELLANVAAGNADTPWLSREQALRDLEQVVRSLLQDQKDPQVSSRGLLSNFLYLERGRRLGPLDTSVDEQEFLDTFGREKGRAIWQALIAKGWLNAPGGGREASILRGTGYGSRFFDGPLEPYADVTTRNAIMEILDRRTIEIIFGDNANLSASMAAAIGALLAPGVRDTPGVAELREIMEQFLDNQREGYLFLYDPRAGLFSFGWDANRNRFFSWRDEEGNVRPVHMDYLVNEFRGPTAFVILRYGLPTEAFANLAFTMKPYRLRNGREVHVLAPWEGSAFQALGLGLSLAGGGDRSWQILMDNVVQVQIDFSRRHGLPGFLSESYVGHGTRYTGDVGIPDIAVNPKPRITHVASLYALGMGYGVSPGEVERFLADKWETISTLMTDHGPWEGYDVRQNEPVRIQTSAHTLSLILGLLGTGRENMMRYLESAGLRPGLQEIYVQGEKANLLADGNQSYAWDVGGAALQSERGRGLFRVRGLGVQELGVAFVSSSPQGLNLSNGALIFRYRSGEALRRARLQLKPPAGATAGLTHLPMELHVRLEPTAGREAEIRIPLPATLGLSRIREVVLVGEPAGSGGAVDLSITGLEFAPYDLLGG